MNDPRRMFPRAETAEDAERAQVADLMRRALAAINEGRIPAGGLTPESVAQLARNLGATDPAQIAALQRMMMLGPGMATPTAPQHVLFMLDSVECALPSDAVQGVERSFEVTRVPNVAGWVMGITQLWGGIVSVVDLRAFIGLPSLGITPRSRLLAVSQRDMMIGFLVDVVTEIRTMGDSIRREQGAGAPRALAPYVAGAAERDGRVIFALDPEKLLFNESIQRYRVS